MQQRLRWKNKEFFLIFPFFLISKWISISIWHRKPYELNCSTLSLNEKNKRFFTQTSRNGGELNVFPLPPSMLTCLNMHRISPTTVFVQNVKSKKKKKRRSEQRALCERQHWAKIALDKPKKSIFHYENMQCVNVYLATKKFDRACKTNFIFYKFPINMNLFRVQ